MYYNVQSIFKVHSFKNKIYRKELKAENLKFMYMRKDTFDVFKNIF